MPAGRAAWPLLGQSKLASSHIAASWTFLLDWRDAGRLLRLSSPVIKDLQIICPTRRKACETRRGQALSVPDSISTRRDRYLRIRTCLPPCLSMDFWARCSDHLQSGRGGGCGARQDAVRMPSRCRHSCPHRRVPRQKVLSLLLWLRFGQSNWLLRTSWRGGTRGESYSSAHGNNRAR